MPERQLHQVAELTLPQLRAEPPNVVVMPFGATEPHGNHLPYATDIVRPREIDGNARVQIVMDASPYYLSSGRGNEAER